MDLGPDNELKINGVLLQVVSLTRGEVGSMRVAILLRRP
jgi:hypothetical protein